MRTNSWAVFQKENHLQPELDKSEFDSLETWDFCWFLLEPIDIIQDQEEDEISVSKRYSPGQKALHFFWYLDAQVTNGGFIQFYLNGYGKYIPAILEGLIVIGDNDMISLVKQADELYERNIDRFNEQMEKMEEEGWGKIYDDMDGFDTLDRQYYELHDHTVALLEAYARKNPDDFGILK